MFDQTIPSFSIIRIKLKISSGVKKSGPSRILELPIKIFLHKGVTLDRLLFPADCETEDLILFTAKFLHSDQFIPKGTVMGHLDDVESVGE